MLICMQSTSVRIDIATHHELKRLAADLDTTVGNTVALPFALCAKTTSASSYKPLSDPTKPPGSMPNSGDVVDLDLGRPRGP